MTDNKALADILNAEEAYKGKDTRIIQNMESITDHLAGISMEGWTTRETGHNYLLWRPRKQNKLADYMANKAMNGKQSWQWTWPGVKQIRSVPSYQVFTDGGRRNESSASAAWVISIIINGGFKLAGHGGHFHTNTDSFQAEALAVEMALKHWATLRISASEFSCPVKPWPNNNPKFSTILTRLACT